MADRIFGRSNIWPLRRSVHMGPANRPQIRSLRRANIRPLGKRPSLELGRPSSRATPCERPWPAEYLHGTTKKVSIDYKAFSK